MAEKVGGIYKITNLVNGKFYVGSSVDIKNRLRQHFGNLRRGTHHNHHLQNAWNKYGAEAFEHSMLEQVTGIETLVEREQFWIDELQANERGYNARTKADSNFGHCPSPETRAKIGAVNRGRKITEEQRAKQMAYWTPEARAEQAARKRGLKMSDAHRAKLSAINKGKKISDAQRRGQSVHMMGNTRSLGVKRSEETKQKMSLAMRAARARIRQEKLIQQATSGWLFQLRNRNG